MRFKSKEELFHDIPAPGHTLSPQETSPTTDCFARWYFEEGLTDGAERAALKFDPYSDDFSAYCRSAFPNALREAIDLYLDREKPLKEFPKPETLKILIGDDLVSFNILSSDYVKGLSKELDSTLGILQEYKYKHFGEYKRKKRRVAMSMILLLVMMLILIFDLPFLLIDGPVQSIYELVRPLLPWGDRSVAHLLIPGVIDLILCGILGGVLISKTKAGIPHYRERLFRGYSENMICSAVEVSALVWPFILLVRIGMGFSFLEGVGLVLGVEAADPILKVINSLTQILVSGLFLSIPLILIYLIALLDQGSYYLYLCRKKKSLLAWEAQQVAKDAKNQWSFYETYLSKLESTDRQLKFLEIWNQVLDGKGKFSGLFDINDYIKKGERTLLPSNVPLWQKWEAQQEEALLQEQENKQRRKKQMEEMQKKNQRDEKAETILEIASVEKRREALAQFPLFFSEDGKLHSPEDAFSLLRTALGFSKLTPAEPYPSNEPGRFEYDSGLQCEMAGQHYMVAMEDYQNAAQQGHMLALARLANIYDTDQKLDSTISYGDVLNVEQWSHPMEHEAEQARLMMGLTPNATVSCLLRHAWNPQVGFDYEVLYYLALHCIDDYKLAEEITKSVCLFTSTLLAEAADKENSRCAYYLADLNLKYYKNLKNSCLWAKVSAGLGYGPAMYFLYEHQKDLGLDSETARMYCYQAWEKNYPPARICKVWDKLTEKRHQEIERQINQARETALREARECQKREQLEAYKKQLEDRERLWNLVLRDVYLDDDEAYLAELMSVNEFMTGKILKERKLENYKKMLDLE